LLLCDALALTAEARAQLMNAARQVPGGGWSGPAGAALIPRQLPAASPHFTGRDAELMTLSARLERANGTGRPAAVFVITGPAGVGKTALAIHWAHRVAGEFPDGQLHVDLRGFAPAGSPLDPADVLHAFLQALGVRPEAVPARRGPHVPAAELACRS
jgi:hypothetical protein